MLCERAAGYFDNNVRWGYYRLNSLGHNVIKFNNESQSTTAAASITSFGHNASIDGSNGVADGWAVVDMAAAYSHQNVTDAARGFLFFNNGSTLIVADSFNVSASSISNVTWAMHINGTVSVAPDGQSATLSPINDGSGATATLQILPSTQGTVCSGLSITAFSNIVLDGNALQYPMNGVTRIEVTTTQVAGCSSIAVSIGDPVPASEELPLQRLQQRSSTPA